MPINEFEALLGQGQVSKEVLVEKGDLQETGLSLREPRSNRFKRLNGVFVQKPALRFSLFDELWGAITMEGRITERRHSHIKGGRSREWFEDYRPRHVLSIPSSRIMLDELEDWRAGYYEPDSGDPEEIDWASLEIVNAGWKEPTIGSATSFQYRVREFNR